jgi:hypothetical protein
LPVVAGVIVRGRPAGLAGISVGTGVVGAHRESMPSGRWYPRQPRHTTHLFGISSRSSARVTLPARQSRHPGGAAELRPWLHRSVEPGISGA